MPGGLGRKKTENRGVSPRVRAKALHRTFCTWDPESGPQSWEQEVPRPGTGSRWFKRWCKRGKQAYDSLRPLASLDRFHLLCLNPSQPSAGAVRTQSLCQRGPMHRREELLPPVQLPQRADTEPRAGNAGLAPGFQVLSPITGKEKTPGDRLRPALSKRFNLARLPSSRKGGGLGGGRQTAIYLRPLADMRKW